jgi:SAM-dependent methyltransferase
MAEPSVYSEINSGKEAFDDIYNQPVPSGYFQTLGALDYEIPSTAKPVLRTVIAALKDSREIEVPTVLDLGCSYGINGALLKYDLEVSDLVERYAARELNGTPLTQIIGEDARFFDALKPSNDIRMVGLDIADRAVDYAVKAGILDAGITANLEQEALPSRAAEMVAEVDLIASTGCIGYVTERTFDRLAPAATDGDAPWVASFVLRMFPYDGIAATLDSWGLVTEKLEGRTFTQRRFASADEQAHVIAQLDRLGLDPSGLEAEGQFHAEFYLSRPKTEVIRLPLETLVEA